MRLSDRVDSSPLRKAHHPELEISLQCRYELEVPPHSQPRFQTVVSETRSIPPFKQRPQIEIFGGFHLLDKTSGTIFIVWSVEVVFLNMQTVITYYHNGIIFLFLH